MVDESGTGIILRAPDFSNVGPSKNKHLGGKGTRFACSFPFKWQSQYHKLSIKIASCDNTRLSSRLKPMDLLYFPFMIHNISLLFYSFLSPLSCVTFSMSCSKWMAIRQHLPSRHSSRFIFSATKHAVIVSSIILRAIAKKSFDLSCRLSIWPRCQNSWHIQ
jgi:hypothetical protein